MKTNLSIWIVGVLAGILTNECRANLNGSDNFDDNSKDPTRWGTDFSNGVGVLTETNGRLEYTTLGLPSGFDFVAHPWTLNSASYTQDWEIQIDVNSPVLGQRVDLGLLVGPGSDPTVLFTNRFNMQFNKLPGQDFHEFRCAIATDTVEQELGTPQSAPAFAALRVVFNASTRTLSGYYDDNGPECGYSWKLLGASTVPAAWNMTVASVFGISLMGKSANAVIASTNNVFMDNFAAFSGTTPRLAISRVGGSVVLAWPTNNPTCHLELTPSLTPPVCWQSVTNAPGIVGTNFTVTNTVSSDKRFYQLSR